MRTEETCPIGQIPEVDEDNKVFLLQLMIIFFFGLGLHLVPEFGSLGRQEEEEGRRK